MAKKKDAKKDKKRERELAPVVDAELVPAPPRDAGLPGLGAMLRSALGAHLCYGDAVVSGERTVIPVARAWGVGGLGGGNNAQEEGGGGGGIVATTPVGFIEIGPAGAEYRRVEAGRPGRVAIGAVALLAGLLLKRPRAAKRSRLPRRLLRR